MKMKFLSVLILAFSAGSVICVNNNSLKNALESLVSTNDEENLKQFFLRYTDEELEFWNNTRSICNELNEQYQNEAMQALSKLVDKHDKSILGRDYYTLR